MGDLKPYQRAFLSVACSSINEIKIHHFDPGKDLGLTKINYNLFDFQQAATHASMHHTGPHLPWQQSWGLYEEDSSLHSDGTRQPANAGEQTLLRSISNS